MNLVKRLLGLFTHKPVWVIAVRKTYGLAVLRTTSVLYNLDGNIIVAHTTTTEKVANALAYDSMQKAAEFAGKLNVYYGTNDHVVLTLGEYVGIIADKSLVNRIYKKRLF